MGRENDLLFLPTPATHKKVLFRAKMGVMKVHFRAKQQRYYLHFRAKTVLISQKTRQTCHRK